MDHELTTILTNRMQYLSIVEKDIAETEKQREEQQNEIAKCEGVVENIKCLGERPSWGSMLQLSKRVFVPGTLKHTGEYMVNVKGYPASYSMLHTAKDTTDYLERKLAEHKKHLELLESRIVQLTERSKLLRGESIPCSDKEEDNELPAEIVSDKGVAVRVGEFYEIIESEEV